MKIRNEIILSEKFADAFTRLLKLSFPATTSLQLIATGKVFHEQQKNIYLVRDTLLDRLTQKDEQGKIKLKNTTGGFGNPIFIDQESENEFRIEMDGLLKVECDIPLQEKLSLTDKIIISAEDILILESIIKLD